MSYQYPFQQAPAFQGAYQQPFPAQRQEFMQAAAQQPGSISARYVMNREEAVAAQILPDGKVVLFAEMDHGKIYSKQINPITGLVDFGEYTRVQAIQPSAQFALLEGLEALKREVEQIKMMLTKEEKENA